MLHRKKATLNDKIYFVGVFVSLLMVVFIFVPYVFQPMYDAVSGLSANNTYEHNKTMQVLNKVNPTDVNNWLDIIGVFFYIAMQLLISVVLPLKVPYTKFFIVVLFVFSFGFSYAIAVIANVIYDVLTSMNSSIVYTKILLQYWLLAEVFFLLLMGLMVYIRGRDMENPINYGY